MNISEFKVAVKRMEQRVIDEKGKGYLDSVYEKEGVNDHPPGSITHRLAKFAALSLAGARIDGEHDAATVFARQLQSRPDGIALGDDHATAAKRHADLIAEGKSLEAGQFFEANREILMRPGATRFSTREAAEAAYMALYKAGRSYEAGQVWAVNRDLLS